MSSQPRLLSTFVTGALIALIALPSTAIACPTAADLGTGIRFDLTEGEWEIFTLTGDGVVQSDLHFGDGEGVRVLLGKGLYVLQIVDFDGNGPISDTRENFSYPLRPSEMPEPVTGGGWSVTAAVLGPEGVTQEVQVYSYGAVSPQTYGACTYDRMEITIDYPEDTESEVSRDFIHYLPELGLSYLAGFEDDEGREMYTYTGVRVLP